MAERRLRKPMRMMMDAVNALEFGREWEAAWNRRDVEAVLKHFHDDAVFTSPVGKRIGFAEDGVVNEKDALRRYWKAALAQNPDLHFEVTTVYQGTNTLAIAYKNQKGMDGSRRNPHFQAWPCDRGARRVRGWLTGGPINFKQSRHSFARQRTSA